MWSKECRKTGIVTRVDSIGIAARTPIRWGNLLMPHTAPPMVLLDGCAASGNVSESLTLVGCWLRWPPAQP
jgi:hypothetical protein